MGLSIIRDNEDPSVTRLVDHLFRHQAGQVVATLTRILGPQHLQLAEDAVQEALVKALKQWAFSGVPDNPPGWIMRVARNQAIDILRREQNLQRKQPDLVFLQTSLLSDPAIDLPDDDLRDDQLRLMFICCHPVLSQEAQVALTLKTLAGFGVPEIARAFLTSEATVAQRIVRAKRTIRERGIAYEVPEGADLEHRIDSVLSVLYLFFNEGYAAHQGADLVRQDLCAEAIRLTSILASRPVGDQPRVHALLALMLLQASRLPARVDDNGDLLLLEQQDRRLWDRKMIAAGFSALDRAACGDRISAYHLQAGIAAEHAIAPGFENTNWQRILDYYTDLVRLTGSPVSKLNRVVALAKVEGPLAGLNSLEHLRDEPALEHYCLFHATVGELHRQSGQYPAARVSFSRALDLTGNDAERRFLQQRLRECTASTG